MNLVKVISSEIDNTKRRIVKFLRYGKSDVQTSFEAMPFGIDSNPTKDLIAIYGATGENGKTVIVGYINKNQIADVGELRLFSTDSDNAEKFYIYLKNDGNCEIGGDADNMVRYSKLQSAFDELKQDFNNHIQNWNAFSAAYAPGSPTTLGTPPTALTSQGSNADITQAKINEIKTL